MQSQKDYLGYVCFLFLVFQCCLLGWVNARHSEDTIPRLSDTKSVPNLESRSYVQTKCSIVESVDTKAVEKVPNTPTQGSLMEFLKITKQEPILPKNSHTV